MDGNFARGGCPDPATAADYQCPDMDSCGLKLLWAEVKNAVENILNHTTFDDIGKRTLLTLARKSDCVRYEV